jgi:hypothetical protein
VPTASCFRVVVPTSDFAPSRASRILLQLLLQSALVTVSLQTCEPCPSRTSLKP